MIGLPQITKLQLFRQRNIQILKRGAGTKGLSKKYTPKTMNYFIINLEPNCITYLVPYDEYLIDVVHSSLVLVVASSSWR